MQIRRTESRMMSVQVLLIYLLDTCTSFIACERLLFLTQFRHFLESIRKSDVQKTKTYRGILEQEAVKGQQVSCTRSVDSEMSILLMMVKQETRGSSTRSICAIFCHQAFDTVKEELQVARQKHANKLRDLSINYGHIGQNVAPSKRETPKSGRCKVLFKGELYYYRKICMTASLPLPLPPPLHSPL